MFGGLYIHLSFVNSKNQGQFQITVDWDLQKLARKSISNTENVFCDTLYIQIHFISFNVVWSYFCAFNIRLLFLRSRSWYFCLLFVCIPIENLMLQEVESTGCPRKNAPMLLESVETWEHFFWDTWYNYIVSTIL